MTPRYECPQCGARDVQVCFPIWLNANMPNDTQDWQERLDHEADPYTDSSKGYCGDCDENVLVKLVEAPAAPVCPQCGEEVTHAEGDVYGLCCNMHKSCPSETF